MLALTLTLAAAAPASPPPSARPHVVLISMDTTRADALSCYRTWAGPARFGPVTPRLDAIAAEGIRFSSFYANSPSTLSSHTTLFTGLDPHGHGVVRNGFPVDPSLPTLAERLEDHGYDTVAIIGAAALESAMGLDRGFRVYDDDTPVLRGIMYQDTASHVVSRALAEVDARPDPRAPLFLFVHFYDPHTPYVPPEPFRSQIRGNPQGAPLVSDGARFKRLAQATREGHAEGPQIERLSELYLGEVAYMDHHIGALVDGLDARGLLDPGLLVITADHGETLADEAPYAWSHGSHVPHEVMWVPLIVRARGLPLAQRAVVTHQAAMDGLARTVERAVGLEPTLGTGLDVYDLLRPGPLRPAGAWPSQPVRPVRMEATRPRVYEAPDTWNNLPLARGLLLGGWGAWSAPFARVPLTPYDAGRLPHPAILDTLQRALATWDAQVPPHREASMPDATRRALEALGYLEPSDP